MPLPPKPSTSHSRNDAYAPSDYAYKKRVVLQILKDWHIPFSTSRGSIDDSAPSTQEGHWNLNGEVLARQKANEIAESHRIVAAELEVMKKISPFYSAVASVFLQDDVSHTTYDNLKAQADSERAGQKKRQLEQLELYKTARPTKANPTKNKREIPTDGYTDSMRLFDAVETGLHMLVYRLLDVDLYCVFPEIEVKTERRENAEEKYLRLAKVFDRHCDEISKTRVRFRNRAYDATAEETGESRNTVEQAIHYRDNDENHGQLVQAKKHRNEKEKCPGRAVPEKKTIKGTTGRIDENLMDERLFHAAHGVVHPDAKLTEKEND